MSCDLGSARGATRVAASLVALAASTCAFAPEAERRIPGGYVLMQKADFEALYDKDGRIVRLLQDRNHDGRAEVLILYPFDRMLVAQSLIEPLVLLTNDRALEGYGAVVRVV